MNGNLTISMVGELGKQWRLSQMKKVLWCVEACILICWFISGALPMVISCGFFLGACTLLLILELRSYEGQRVGAFIVS